MRARVLLLLLLLLLLLAPAPAGAATAAPPGTAAEVTACSTSVTPAKRFMVVQGRMRAIPGADRLQLRFDLRARTPDHPGFRRLAAPGIGVWHTADRGTGRYVVDKRVEGLAAPADYKMEVRFRWLDAQGRVLDHAHRATRVCAQPDLRPDLSPRRITMAPGPEAGTSRYVVPVRNLGGSPAGPFAVRLTVDDRALPAEAVTGLAAGAGTELEFIGPTCAAGQPLAVAVDSEGTVEEASEADNALLRTCPV
jgi:CARDB